MLVFIHILLLISVVITTGIILLFGRGKGSATSWRWLVLSEIPFFCVGCICLLTMSMNGTPRIEWSLPAIAIAVVYLCRPPCSWLRLARAFFLLITLILCVNFFCLITSGEYTANPTFFIRLAKLREKVGKEQVKEMLTKSYQPEDVFRQGPVTEVLHVPMSTDVELVSAEEEWHSLFTNLHRVVRKKAVLWYPGGQVRIASEALELKEEQ